jgi:peptidyl-prolyl cis-trans isomerase A (cyclophilin A)
MRRLLALLLITIPITLLSQNSSQPTAIIATTAGKITCTLFPDKAPKSVANFIGLAEGTKDWTDPVTHAKKHGVPLYDGTIFHRVIPGFMIQGGDPAGTGAGTPGYGFGLEVTPELKYDRPGRLAYARTSDPNSNGSQFFITVAPYPSLDMQYTIFGQCENQDVVQKIANAPRGPNDRPNNPVKINHITIMKGSAPAAKPKSKS